MTDAASGSVAATVPAAGNPSAPGAPAEKGSSAAAPSSWLDGLSEGNRALAQNKGWTDLNKVLTGYAELEAFQGQSIRVPAEDASPEERERFLARLGRPENAEHYEFKRPEGLSPDLPYNDGLAQAAKPWLHQAGLSQKQAEIIHDGFARFAGARAQAAREAQARAVEETHDVLVREWGPMESERFRTNLALASRAVAKLGLGEALARANILLADGAVTDPQMVKAFAAVGEAMFREDTLEARGGGPGGDNPFRAGVKANITAQSALIKNDPERARRLIREAGLRVSDFFPDNPR